jgi:hypothetical protein
MGGGESIIFAHTRVVYLFLDGQWSGLPRPDSEPQLSVSCWVHSMYTVCAQYVHGIFLAVHFQTRTVSLLKLRRPGLDLTERCKEEDPCNIWSECFCSFTWFKNVFLIINMKVYETPDWIQK